MSSMKELLYQRETAAFMIAEREEEIRKLKMEIQRLTNNVDAKRERITRLSQQIYVTEQQI